MNGPVPGDEWQGKVAVVTGGHGGIGLVVARALRDRGAAVHVLDNAPRAPAFAGVSTERPYSGSADKPPPGAQAEDPSVALHQVDVANEREVDAFFESIAGRNGGADYLVSCAAVFRAMPFLELTPSEWQRTISINLTGAFFCCRAALRQMRAKNFGRIVLLSSMLARTGGINAAHYAASKGGVLGLMRSAALEMANRDVRINSISPGVTDTPQPRGHMSEEELEAYAASVPLGRLASAEDVAEACMFLLSDESSFLTGQDLRLNGGSRLW